MKAPKNCLSCSRRKTFKHGMKNNRVYVLGGCIAPISLSLDENCIECEEDGCVICFDGCDRPVVDCPSYQPHSLPISLPDRALIVRAPYSRLICSGAKTVEVRGSATNIRGRIGIIEAVTHRLIGEAELVSCHPVDVTFDCAEAILFQPLAYKTPHAWRLGRAIYYPKAYQIPTKPGAVIWRILSPQLNATCEEEKIIWQRWHADNLPTRPGSYELKYRDNTTETIRIKPWFIDMAIYEPIDLQVDYLDGSELMELTDVMPYLTEWRGPIPEAEALNPA